MSQIFLLIKQKIFLILECHNKAKIEEEKDRKKLKLKNSNKNSIEAKELITENLSREEEEILENFFPKYDLPKHLKQFNTAILPPSLKPPTYKDFLNFEINSWS